MKIVRQLLIILLFVFIGESVSIFLHLPIPGNIMGMLFLLIALLTGLLKLPQIETAADFLLEHMAVLFIPAGVGILTVMGFIQDIWLFIVIISVVSTIVVMAATALIVNFLRKGRE